MGNDAVSPLRMEHITDVAAYERAETISSILARAQHITSTRVQQVAMVSIKLNFEEDHLRQTQASTKYLLDNLRPLVRKTDVIFLLSSTLYFLLLGAKLEGGQIVQDRLWEALLWRVHNINEGEVLRPRSMSIGHSAHPLPCSTIDELLEAAESRSLFLDCQPERTSRKDIARHAQHTQHPSPDQLDEELHALARKLGIPYLSLLPSKLPRRLQELVNPKLAQELNCYPIGRERNMLTVAMLNPQDRSVLDRLSQETGLRIFPVLTHPQVLQNALERFV